MRSGESLPDAYKLNIDIDREGLLKLVALLPPKLVLASVHLVREGDLLVIAGGQQPNL